MVGVKDTKEVVVFMAALANAIDLAGQDGKFDIGDAALLMGPLMKAGPALSDIKNVKLELADLSEEEKKELLELSAQELSLSNEKVEKVVMSSLKILGEVQTIIACIKEMKAAEAPAEAPQA